MSRFKLLSVMLTSLLLLGCNTGVYELETPDKDLLVHFWAGEASDGQESLFQINGEGAYYTGNIKINKENADDFMEDLTGMSGFTVNIDSEGSANFLCTRSKTDDDGDKTCTRFETSTSTITDIPVNTEYRP
jgi:hypothetical protein